MQKYSKILRNIKHIFAITLISLSILFGAVRLFSGEFSHAINGFFLYRTGSGAWQDMFHRHALKPGSDIAIINIDERSLNTLQAASGSDLRMVTIPKSTYTDLVNKLESAGVKGIAFDIVFQNKDPDEDAFVAAMSTGKNVVIGASADRTNACVTDMGDGSTTCTGYPRRAYTSIPWGIFNIGSLTSGQDGSIAQSAYTRPIRVDINSGEWKSEPGNWKYTLGLPTDLYSLSIALLATHDDKITRKVEFRDSIMLSPYMGGPRSYPTYSLIDIVTMSSADELAKRFGGKYVFIGESGTMMHDYIITPATGTRMDGVETHAHFLDAILQNKLLHKFGYDFLLIVAISIIAIILYYTLPKLLSPIFAIVIMGAILYLCRLSYDTWRTVIDIFPLFLAGGLLTFPATFVYRFFVVDREKRQMQKAFGHYVDPRVVQMIDDEQLQLSLGGERREVTLFFSDIAGFTSLSEKIGTQDLFYVMSSYLSRMTDILIHEGGTLDKYIGDSIMGFFGAPVSLTDHAVRACRTALAMRGALPAFNADIQSRGIEPLDFRVGIATGEALIGNIGSQDHFNYTALGDTVNLASRLEGAGKEYGVHVIISEATRLLLDDSFVVRELDMLAVKGKTIGIRIYELVGYTKDVTNMSVINAYERALGLYREGKYLEAGQLWESQMATDKASEVMARRCVALLKGEVQLENGVFMMTHK